jgi:hypothetical protein
MTVSAVRGALHSGGHYCAPIHTRKKTTTIEMTPERLHAYGETVRSLLRGPDAYLRKQWVQHFVAEVVVYPDHIRVRGPEDQILKTLRFDEDRPLLPVPSFAREWRSLRESNPPLQRERLPS